MPKVYNNTAYSLSQGPLSVMYPLPILAKRAPTTADNGFPLGQMWIQASANLAWVLTSVVSNSATWTSVNSSTAASLVSLTITGAAPNLTINSMTTPGILVNSATGSVTSDALTNGQVLIGSTNNPPVPATLTAGAGIAISNGAGTITISQSGSGETWSAKAISFPASAGNGYVITAGSGSITATLPANNALGDTVEIIYPSATASDVLIVTSGAAAADIRIFGNGTAFTTLTWPACNLAGSANPSVTLVCTTASATQPKWTVTEINGNPTGS